MKIGAWIFYGKVGGWVDASLYLSFPAEASHAGLEGVPALADQVQPALVPPPVAHLGHHWGGGWVGRWVNENEKEKRRVVG